MRGENSTSVQLRDDLMTMLIAGHETSAAVLTWTLFELTRHPEALKKVTHPSTTHLSPRSSEGDKTHPPTIPIHLFLYSPTHPPTHPPPHTGAG